MNKVVELLKMKNIHFPKLLLDNYNKLKLSSEELIIIIFLINENYNPKAISEKMNIKLPLFLEKIESLKEKGILEIVVSKENNIVTENVNLNPLYEKLSLLIMEDKKESSTLFDSFEKELGRTLSPMEYEIINEWKETSSEELILLALKEAIYNGVNNFRYIDRIVHEWNKKGIKTKEDVIKNSKEFKKKNNSKKELFDYDWLNDETDK